MTAGAEAWRSYASAPAPGAAIMRDADVIGAATVDVDGPSGAFPVIVLRVGGAICAYVNACPHQYLPLNHRGPQIVSADGARLMCTVHGAQFRAEDGVGVAGPGLGCALDRVPVHVDQDGMIRVGGR
ncbi:MAG: nitrite reductase/ring-hydroxylating ferredoxin subunit [Paracoccaceae bacterium]|jgi:nitrite reductase/ring-hydroxylating ferredoxin subunit